MDKDQWRKILFDAIPPPAAQSCEVQEGWMAKLDKAADAIAQAHEQEVAQFRAQGAVLGEALREIEEDASGTNQPGTDWVYLKRIGILAQQALSAAPKVLCSTKFRIEPGWCGGNGLDKHFYDPKATSHGEAGWLNLDFALEEETTLVALMLVDCSVKEGCSRTSEQPQESEQGFPGIEAFDVEPDGRIKQVESEEE